MSPWAPIPSTTSPCRRAQPSATRHRRRNIATATFFVILAGCTGATPPPAAPAPAEVGKPADGEPFALPEAGSPYATSLVDELVVYTEPSPDAPVVDTLGGWSYYGLPLTLMILDHRIDGETDWLEVLLPVRPNGTTGWIVAHDVDVDATTVEIHVHLERRHVEVFDGGELLLDHEAVIGHPETPTPPGLYYVTDPVDLRLNPDSVYGAFAIGLSGFSEVLDSFEGGPPQLAIHGTPRPDQVGQAISNGCIRVPDDIVVDIADLAPLGTPVHIHP